ncbi:hypothetical protein MBLNU457_4942t1 [Dothideomycetes sp. NU457]
MGGFAHVMLLKAKNSIDTMRGASSSSDPHDEEAGLLVNERVKDVPKGGSLRHHVKERMAEPHKLHRATSSLRRVMTNSSKRATRGSLFEALSPRDSDSVELPTGPDAVTQEEKSPSANSIKRLSMGSIRKMASPISKRSSKQSSPLAKADRDTDQPSTPTPKRSSPIPIPQTSSPAPAIHFEIESGSLSPKTMFGITDHDSSQDGSIPKIAPEHTGGSLKRPLSRIMSRKRPKSASKDRSKDHHSEDLPRVHVPRRASNDHWRMRNVSRKKSQQSDDLPIPVSQDVGPPSPMSGTNLPLDDPFDPTSSTREAEQPVEGVLPAQRKSASILSIDGVMEVNTVDGTTLFDSTEKLMRPRLLTDAELELKQDLEHIKVMLIQVREAAIPTSDKQPLVVDNERSPVSDSSSQYYDFADRLRSIETYVEKISSDIANITALSTTERSELAPQAEPSELQAESSDLQVTSPEPSIASGYQSPVLLKSSTRESSESYQSPLVTQALYYPSPPIAPIADDDRSSEHGSALSAADQYLQSIRGIATNGRPEVEDNASATVKLTTGPVLETLEEAGRESPLDEHLPSEPLPKVRRLTDRNRTSSFDLIEYWRTMDEGKHENDHETADEAVAETNSSDPERPSVNRQDSSCFIPVCFVCGSTDDHICSRAPGSLAEAQNDGSVAQSETTKVVDDQTPPTRTKDAVTEASPLKRRAASSEVPDPFSPKQQISLWASENYFAPTTRCKAHDDVVNSVSSVSSVSKSHKRNCNSPSKTSPAVGRVRSTENKKGRYASFCSDTDLDSDVDDTDFLRVGGALSTFHPLM